MAWSWGSIFADILVEKTVIIELKAAKDDNEIFVAQCLNYLKATGLPDLPAAQFRQTPPRNQTLTRISSRLIPEFPCLLSVFICVHLWLIPNFP